MKYRSSWKNKVSHVEELVSSPTALQRVVSRVIKNYADTPSSNLDLKKKLISTSAEASTSFTSEQLFRFQADLGLSNTQTKLLGVTTGWRKTVEHGFKERLTKNSYEYFKELKINYWRFDKNTKMNEHFEQSTNVCTVLCKFVDLVSKVFTAKTVNLCLLKLELTVRLAFSKYACQFLTWII